MRAVIFDTPGEADVLVLGEAPSPTLHAGEVRIRVAATAVNRADLLQRRGLYPPPPGASSILGLEAAGTISEVGAGVTAFSPGQRVMALLPGGGYAEEVVVSAALALPVPERLSLTEAAAVPETFLTAYLNLFQLGGLRFGGAPDEAAALIHGGASGVGTAALQLCRESGVAALCTVGSIERARRCRDLGAKAVWNYHDGDFTDWALEVTGQRGVDVVLDCIGGKYLDRNVRVLAMEGRLLCIGLQGGMRAELDLARVLAHRLRIIGSTLRALPLARKAALVEAFARDVLPLLAAGRVAPVVDRVLPMREAAAAHRAMDEHHVGKIVLAWDEAAA